MRPLKILRLVFLFILMSSLSHAGVQARRATHVRHENSPRPVGPARTDPTPLAPEQTAPSARLLPSRDRLINSAYLDAAGILSEENACSRFFGGPYAALTVLTRLAGQLRKTRLAPGVGIQMSGYITDFNDPKHGLSYRLFEKAMVNVAGPFNSRQRFPTDPPIQSVGSFQPDTREARALMLLHEIGHLISGPDKNWLLPNDGDDEAQSEKNTRFIESKCGEQIKALRSR